MVVLTMYAVFLVGIQVISNPQCRIIRILRCWLMDRGEVRLKAGVPFLPTNMCSHSNWPEFICC